MSNRVRLNLRVPSDSLEAFNVAVEEEFGQRVPYAPVELERELKTWADSGSLSRLHNNITTLGGVLDSGHRKKKSQKPPRGETEIVQYYVSESVRTEFMEAATNDDRAPGTIVGDLMYRYAATGDVASREADRLSELVDVAADRTAEESVSGAEKIANELNQPEFSMSELEEAIKVSYSSVSYAKERYLSGVLDELGSTWHPENRELFISCDADCVPDERDPRSKPYVLMSDSDKQAAIKRELEEQDTAGTMTETLSITEAINTLHGRPQRTTARQLCEKIASSDGYHIVEPEQGNGYDEPRLAVSPDSGTRRTHTTSSSTETEVDTASVDTEFEQLEQAQPAVKTDGGEIQ